MSLTPEEQAAARARQKRRYQEAAAIKQYEEREHLRGEIPSRKIVQMNAKIMDIMLSGKEDLILPSGQVVEVELDRTRIAALKVASEIGFKFLSKTVPDLKQIELRADVTQEQLPQTITYKVVESYDDEVD